MMKSRAYVATGDPLDKAGAYAIQNAGFHPVELMQGCYASVMGLPLCHPGAQPAAASTSPRAAILRRSASQLWGMPVPFFLPCWAGKWLDDEEGKRSRMKIARWMVLILVLIGLAACYGW